MMMTNDDDDDGDGNDDDKDEITFQYFLSDIIGSTLQNKMGKNDPEFKAFNKVMTEGTGADSSDHVI